MTENNTAPAPAEPTMLMEIRFQYDLVSDVSPEVWVAHRLRLGIQDGSIYSGTLLNKAMTWGIPFLEIVLYVVAGADDPSKAARETVQKFVDGDTDFMIYEVELTDQQVPF